jgi:hypothetical protein
LFQLGNQLFFGLQGGLLGCQHRMILPDYTPKYFLTFPTTCADTPPAFRPQLNTPIRWPDLPHSFAAFPAGGCGVLRFPLLA